MEALREKHQGRNQPSLHCLVPLVHMFLALGGPEPGTIRTGCHGNRVWGIHLLYSNGIICRETGLNLFLSHQLPSSEYKDVRDFGFLIIFVPLVDWLSHITHFFGVLLTPPPPPQEY